jgi:hypothetical protein
MISLLKYRIIGLALVAIFAIFNIGLPIVVASCPMVKDEGSNRCAMCNDASSSGTVRFTNSVDRSCCVTKFATDRNRTEFLQIQLEKFESRQQIITTFVSAVPESAILNAQSFIRETASPPRSVDIPILVSSLLI